MRDHPRLRGEKQNRRIIDFKMKGSPPLTRGKEDSVDGDVWVLRITPAYAGKRISQRKKLSLP